MSLRDAKVNPNLSCAHGQTRWPTKQPLPRPCLWCPSAIPLNQSVRGHRAQESPINPASTSTFPHHWQPNSNPSVTALVARKSLFKLAQFCLPSLSNYWEKGIALFIQRTLSARHYVKTAYSQSHRSFTTTETILISK